MADNGLPPIVIGVDGSEPCAVALDWAAGEAKLRGCTLEVITVDNPGDGLGDRATAQVRAAATRHPSVHVRHRWLTGSPTAALVHAAHGAAMLVVSSRGAGRLARVLLGSVGSYCAAHAECPVVILPAPHVVSRRTHAELARDSIEELIS